MQSTVFGKQFRNIEFNEGRAFGFRLRGNFWSAFCNYRAGSLLLRYFWSMPLIFKSMLPAPRSSRQLSAQQYFFGAYHEFLTYLRA
jgi:hypothetical protein